MSISIMAFASIISFAQGTTDEKKSYRTTWSDIDRGCHIIYRKIKAIVLAIKAYTKSCEGCHYIENQKQ